MGFTSTFSRMLPCLRNATPESEPESGDVVLLMNGDADRSGTLKYVYTGNVNLRGGGPVGVDTGYFDCTGYNEFSVDNHADFAFGTGAFTIELWFRTTMTTGTNHSMIEQATDENWGLWISNAGLVNFHLGLSSTVENVATGSYNDGNWHHLAGVRNGDTVYVFVDGYQRYSNTGYAADSIGASSRNINIGESGTGDFSGEIAEIRVSDVARYTSAFNGSLPGEFTTDGNTMLLMSATHMGDESEYQHDVTMGWVDYRARNLPHNDFHLAPYMAYESVQIANATQFQLGTQMFTLDFWLDLATTGNACTLISHYDSNAAANQSFRILITASEVITMECYSGSGSIGGCTTNTFAIPSDNVWYHIAFVRDGSNNLYYFVDGDLKETNSSFSGTINTSNPKDILLGTDWNDTSKGSQDMYASIDSLRLKTGVAQWTSNFTKPDRPWPVGYA